MLANMTTIHLLPSREYIVIGVMMILSQVHKETKQVPFFAHVNFRWELDYSYNLNGY